MFFLSFCPQESKVKKKPRRVRSEEGKKKDKERKKRNHLCVHLAKLCKVDVAKFKDFLKENKSENPRLAVLYNEKTPESSLKSVPGTSQQGLEDISDEELPIDEPETEEEEDVLCIDLQDKDRVSLPIEDAQLEKEIREETEKEASHPIVKRAQEVNFQRRYSSPQKFIPKRVDPPRPFFKPNLKYRGSFKPYVKNRSYYQNK